MVKNVPQSKAKNKLHLRSAVPSTQSCSELLDQVQILRFVE